MQTQRKPAKLRDAFDADGFRFDPNPGPAEPLAMRIIGYTVTIVGALGVVYLGLRAIAAFVYGIPGA